MPNQPINLDDIETRANNATEGPWDRYPEYGPTFFANVSGEYLRGVGDFNFGVGEQAAADEEFVKHAVQDVRALVAEVRRLHARVTELETAPATVPAAYELATRAHLADQLKQVIDRCAKRAAQVAVGDGRRDFIARGMGLLSALHLIETGSADNTEQDGEYAGYDEDADPDGGFPDEPIAYADPAGYPAETLLARRGIRQPDGEQQAAGTDTLPAWLQLRFAANRRPWEELTDEDRTWWEHTAQAVRRAVARNGFKTNDETAAVRP